MDQKITIDFNILNRNFNGDYYSLSEYYPVPFHEFYTLCKNNHIDPVVWYRENLHKRIDIVVPLSFSAKQLKRVLEQKIDLPNAFFMSELIHLYIMHKENLYRIDSEEAQLFKLFTLENNAIALYVVLILDDQPEGVAYKEASLKFYFHSKEQGRHHKPHVHVIYGPNQEVVMDIVSAEPIRGSFPNSIMLKRAKRIIEGKRVEFLKWWNMNTDGLSVDINFALGITHDKGIIS